MCKESTFCSFRDVIYWKIPALQHGKLLSYILLVLWINRYNYGLKWTEMTTFITFKLFFPSFPYNADLCYCWCRLWDSNILGFYNVRYLVLYYFKYLKLFCVQLICTTFQRITKNFMFVWPGPAALNTFVIWFFYCLSQSIFHLHLKPRHFY